MVFLAAIGCYHNVCSNENDAGYTAAANADDVNFANDFPCYDFCNVTVIPNGTSIVLGIQ